MIEASYIVKSGTETKMHLPNRRFHAASIIKPIMIDTFLKNNPNSWHRNINIRNDHYSWGSGILNDAREIRQISIKDAAHLAITVSDNTASNIFIDQFGTSPENSNVAISQAMRDHGYTDTDVRAWYGGSHRRRDTENFLTVSEDLFSFDCAGVTSASDVLKSVESLYMDEKTRTMFEQCQDFRGLKKDGALPEGFVAGQKTGYVDGVRHVAGWIRKADSFDNPVFVVVLTDCDSETGWENWGYIDRFVQQVVDKWL